MPAAFGDLSSTIVAIDAVPRGAAVYGSWRLAVLPQDEPYLPAGFATVGAGAHPLVRGLGKAWWTLTGRRTDRYRFMVFPKQHSRRSTRRRCAAHRSRVRTHTAVLSRRVWRAVSPDRRASGDRRGRGGLGGGQPRREVVGVQVRTWRDDARRHRKYHLPALRRLTRLLDGAGTGARFLVVSDSDDVAPMLGERYGAQPRALLSAERRRAPKAGSRRAASRRTSSTCCCWRARRRLFASYLSTFSEVAWWLGGTTARVSVF